MYMRVRLKCLLQQTKFSIFHLDGKLKRGGWNKRGISTFYSNPPFISCPKIFYSSTITSIPIIRYSRVGQHIFPPKSAGLICVRKAFLVGLSAGGSLSVGGGLYEV